MIRSFFECAVVFLNAQGAAAIAHERDALFDRKFFAVEHDWSTIGAFFSQRPQLAFRNQVIGFHSFP